LEKEIGRLEKLKQDEILREENEKKIQVIFNSFWKKYLKKIVGRKKNSRKIAKEGNKSKN
jgi:hypothetical protein